jgi:large repetitive protein
MRCVRHLLWTIALAAFVAGPAAATSVTVQITGTWSSVTDNASVLGGTVIAGTSYVATLVYDDTTPDTDPDPNAGGYDVPAATSDLSISTSTFTFTPGAASLLGIAIDNNNAFGEDALFLFTDGYTATGLPAGITLGGTRYANPTLTDTSGTAYSSDALSALPWVIGDYDITSFYFFSQIVGAGSNKFIELQGTITGLSVLPEPSTLALTALALLALGLQRIRG